MTDASTNKNDTVNIAQTVLAAMEALSEKSALRTQYGLFINGNSKSDKLSTAYQKWFVTKVARPLRDTELQKIQEAQQNNTTYANILPVDEARTGLLKSRLRQSVQALDKAFTDDQDMRALFVVSQLQDGLGADDQATLSARTKTLLEPLTIAQEKYKNIFQALGKKESTNKFTQQAKALIKPLLYNPLLVAATVADRVVYDLAGVDVVHMDQVERTTASLKLLPVLKTTLYAIQSGEWSAWQDPDRLAVIRVPTALSLTEEIQTASENIASTIVDGAFGQVKERSKTLVQAAAVSGIALLTSAILHQQATANFSNVRFEVLLQNADGTTFVRIDDSSGNVGDECFVPLADLLAGSNSLVGYNVLPAIGKRCPGFLPDAMIERQASRTAVKQTMPAKEKAIQPASTPLEDHQDPDAPRTPAGYEAIGQKVALYLDSIRAHTAA